MTEENSTKPRRWLWLLALALVAAAGLGYAALQRELRRPLDEPLTLNLVTATQTAVAYPTATGTPALEVAVQRAVTPTPTARPLCGGPARLVILAVGADNDSGYYYGLSDAIRLVSVDFTSPSVTVVALPRDLWVSVPAVPGLRAREARINSVYFYGNLYRYPGGGPGLVAQALYDNFGLVVDRYLAVNKGVFEELIDAVGGVDVYVPAGVSDPRFNTRYYGPGWQHLTGEMAVEYASLRPDSDFRRIERQTHVILGLWDKLLQPSTFLRLPRLYDIFREHVLTDLSRLEVFQLACLARRLPEEAVSFEEVPSDMLTPTYTNKGAYILLPDAARLGEFLRAALEGR